MLIQGQAGPVTTTASLSSGIQVPLRQGNMGDAIMSELHGRYYEAAYRRTLFTASNAAAVATVAIGTTTHTGLVVANPIGSLVNLVLNKVSWAASVAVPTAGFLCLETGYNSGTNVTLTTPVTPRSCFVGVGASGYGVAAVSSTLPTAPVAVHFLNTNGSVATTSTGIQNGGLIDLEGSIILPPGAYAAFATFATNTAAWWFSIGWEECPA
jgi:hypothetical protein